MWRADSRININVRDDVESLIIKFYLKLYPIIGKGDVNVFYIISF